VPEGWTLTSIVCDDDNSSGDVDTGTVTFRLEGGETVTCVFTNTKEQPPAAVSSTTTWVAVAVAVAMILGILAIILVRRRQASLIE